MTAYECDRDALTSQFDVPAEALLKEIQTETVAVRATVENQQERVDKVTADVEDVVQQMREADLRTRDELHEIRNEVNKIRVMLPKVVMSLNPTTTLS